MGDVTVVRWGKYLCLLLYCRDLPNSQRCFSWVFLAFLGFCILLNLILCELYIEPEVLYLSSCTLHKVKLLHVSLMCIALDWGVLYQQHWACIVIIYIKEG